MGQCEGWFKGRGRARAAESCAPPAPSARSQRIFIWPPWAAPNQKGAAPAHHAHHVARFPRTEAGQIRRARVWARPGSGGRSHGLGAGRRGGKKNDDEASWPPNKEIPPLAHFSRGGRGGGGLGFQTNNHAPRRDRGRGLRRDGLRLATIQRRKTNQGAHAPKKIKHTQAPTSSRRQRRATRVARERQEGVELPHAIASRPLPAIRLARALT